MLARALPIKARVEFETRTRANWPGELFKWRFLAQTSRLIASRTPLRSAMSEFNPGCAVDLQRGANRRKQSKPLKVGEETTVSPPVSLSSEAMSDDSGHQEREPSLPQVDCAALPSANTTATHSSGSTHETANDQLANSLLRAAVTSSGYITTNPATYVNSVPALNETYCEICNRVLCNKVCTYFLVS